MLHHLASLQFHGRWLFVLAWIVAAAVAAPLALQANQNLKPGGFTSEQFPSVQAWEVFQSELGVTPISLEIVVQHDQYTAYDDEFIATVTNIITVVEAFPDVTQINSHLTDPARVSTDGHTAHISVGIDLALEESVEFVSDLPPFAPEDGFRIIMTGGPSLYRDLGVASAEDLRRGELVALPLAAIVLVLVFGTLAAAIMPVVTGAIGTGIGLAAIFLISQQLDISIFALNIASLLGVGVGIDYSLFMTSRFREELRRGHNTKTALRNMLSKAGSAVLFSGFTSIVGLLSLLLFEINVLRSIAIGASLAIFAAMLATFTLLPALLAILGNNVERFRVLPKGWKIRNGFWRSAAKVVMDRPLVAVLATGALLVVMTLPITQIRLGTVDQSILPDRFESKQGFDILRDEFGVVGSEQSFIVVAYTFDGDPFRESNLKNLYEFGATLAALDGVSSVTSFVNIDPALTLEDYQTLYAVPEAVADREVAQILNTSLNNGIASFVVASTHHSFSPEAQQLAAQVRRIPTNLGESHVAGLPASAKDIVDSLYSIFPWVVAIILGITYLALLVLFRSLLLPLKAILLNVLSISASYGALVFVFQMGNFSGLLGFEPAGVTEFTTPIVLFAILFGLSMDYEIFLLARISEAYKRSGNTREAVTQGLKKSGLVITGAGAILVVVSASFVLADVLIVQAIGFGLALAVFIDVTLIRGIMAPAIIRLAGRWNWYLPNWLATLLDKITPFAASR